MRCLSVVWAIPVMFSCFIATAFAVEPPDWAVTECRGLKAWTDVVYYWIDRQHEDGSFGFGLNDDCEFYEMWPILFFAADDQRILDSLKRAVDWVWYYDGVQEGYQATPRDSAHAGEVTSCTMPMLSFMDYGNPVNLERMMQTSKNIENWTALNWKGHRHFKSNYFGSQEMYTHAYYGSDATVNGRATIPLLHVLWYNRDPDLARYCIEWGRAWIDHAKETTHGKPYGLLPAEVVFETDEPAGFTKLWCEGAIVSYNQRCRLHFMLLIDYLLTGDSDFLLPTRTELELFAQARQGIFPEGTNMRSAQLRRRIVGVEVQGADGHWCPLRYDRVGTELLSCYRAFIGDHRYDRWWGAPPRMIRKDALRAGQDAVKTAKEQFQIAKTINILNGTDNYDASIDQLGQGFPLLYYGIDHSSADITDPPFPPVRWLKSNYELAVIMLQHDRSSFKALCCNVADEIRSFGAQLFELVPGTYRLTLGIDTNQDDKAETIIRDENVSIERGSKLTFDLERGPEYVLELQQLAEGKEWTPRADVAVCDQDIFCTPAAPEPGASAELRVRVHNIGTVDAKAVDVWVEELGSGKFIARKSIACLPRPHNMVPSHITVPIDWKIGPKAKGVRVIVDSGDVIEEIYEGNNAAEIALAGLKEDAPAKRVIYLSESNRAEQIGPVPTYTAPYVEDIVLDGKLDDPGWKKAERRGPLRTVGSKPAEKPTYIRIAYGPDALYVAMEAVEPRMDLLVTEAREHDDMNVFVDDAIEVFIDANGDKLTYYQFAATTKGIMIEGQYLNFTLYNEPWECKIFKGKDFWNAEVKIPYPSLKAKARPGQTWGINVCRNAMTFCMPESEEQRRQGWTAVEFIALSPTGPGYHQPGRFAAVTFGPQE